MTESIDANAVVYIRCPLIKPLKNGAAYDPTGDVVDVSVVPQTQPKPLAADWKTAAWEPPNASGTYWARLLVGPGTAAGAFAAGTYEVGMRIHDNPETPIVTCGYVDFY